MTKVLERIFSRNQQEEHISSEEIIVNLRRLEQQIRENDALFNETLESDLIDACIYDGKALRSRYRYYHNLARSRGLRREVALWMR